MPRTAGTTDLLRHMAIPHTTYVNGNPVAELVPLADSVYADPGLGWAELMAANQSQASWSRPGLRQTSEGRNPCDVGGISAAALQPMQRHPKGSV